jgi:hypothetical protein
MSTDPPLHPRRIMATLRWLQGDLYDGELNQEDHETCLAALRLLQKTQRATGLTSDVADVGAKGLELIKALTRIR